MTIILFAIIGATIKPGTAYWICYAVYCIYKTLKYVDIKWLESEVEGN